MAGLACIPVQFQQEEFRFSSQNRAVTRIQKVASFIGKEWTIARKIGSGETDVGRVGASKRCKLKGHPRAKKSSSRGTVQNNFSFYFS